MTGEKMYRKEAAYLVGDSVYLYLKQSSGLEAIAYETYDRKTGSIQRKDMFLTLKYRVKMKRRGY